MPPKLSPRERLRIVDEAMTVLVWYEEETEWKGPPIDLRRLLDCQHDMERLLAECRAEVMGESNAAETDCAAL